MKQADKPPTRTSRLLLICLVFSLVLVSIPVRALDAQTLSARVTAVDSEIKMLIKRTGIVGLSVAVVSDQDTIFEKGYGYANIFRNIAASAGTLYRVASITKLFTSLSIMVLQDRGLIDIDEPVDIYLPEFTPASRGQSTGKVTVKHLLTHTSGLPVSLGRAAFDDLLEIVKGTRLLFKPGTRFLYSNLGYNVLGKLIERVTNTRYTAFEREEILGFLDMNDSFFWTGKEEKTVAMGYEIKDHSAVEAGHTAYISDIPSASLCSSVRDLGNYLKFLFQDGTFHDQTLLGRGVLDEMMREHAYSRGLGFSIYSSGTNGERIVGHSGSTRGYTGFVVADPGAKIGVVILTNTDDVVYEVQSLARRILDAYRSVKA
jgi:CubicO group peptidase (beta-lactamase class C family)